MTEIFVVGRSRERALSLLMELYLENYDQVDRLRSTRNQVRYRGCFYLKDGTHFVAHSAQEPPEQLLSRNVDQVFYEIDAFNSQQDAMCLLALELTRSIVPSEFQWVKLVDEKVIVDAR